MNELDKDKFQEQLDVVRRDVDKAEQRNSELIRRSFVVKGLVYGIFMGTGLGFGGGMRAIRGEVNVIEAVTSERLDQEARDWLEAVGAEEDSDTLGKDQMTLRCALATPVLALQGMLLGLAVGTGIGTLQTIKKRKK